MPTQPNSAAQSAAKNRFTIASAAWRGLTDVQRAAWNAFADSFTVTNSLGAQIHLTGAQCFVKVNCINSLVGDAAVLVPPALPAFVANVATGINTLTAAPVFKLTAVAPAGNTKILLYASPQLSAGVTYNGKWSFIGLLPAPAAGVSDIEALYSAKFGVPILGKRIFVLAIQSQAGMQDHGVHYTGVVAAGS